MSLHTEVNWGQFIELAVFTQLTEKFSGTAVKVGLIYAMCIKSIILVSNIERMYRYLSQGQFKLSE